jgi:wyosine [tRNA(Phe)-imidazoG37] synthetase (radical SAM superfamily)
MITFGPIPSRRLGLSLGVDVVPLKTCTYNCVYCQLGPTRKTMIRRGSYVQAPEVVEAIHQAVEKSPKVDILTFSGSGEPTLNQQLGAIIRGIKRRFRLPVAVLTNGALLYRSAVRAELIGADIVLPSLDAWTEEMFTRINRPHQSLKLQAILSGMERFRRDYTGEIWLEVLLVRGINDGEEDTAGLVQWVERIQPDRIQINTVSRPPAEPWARAVGRDRMEAIRSALGSTAEIVVPFRRRAEEMLGGELEEKIAEMVRRRPVAPEDLVDAFGMELTEARKLLESLARQRGWGKERHEGKVYVREGTPSRHGQGEGW